MDQPRAHSRQGFTLLELSVVIAIVAIIVGGMMVGKNLMRRAQLSGVMSDLAKYVGVYEQFKVQYAGVPGDITDATDYWGAKADCVSSEDLTPQITTCNGDGDGTWKADAEPFLAWQHLANAGYINGTYSGGSGPLSRLVAGVNSPKTSIKEAGVLYMWWYAWNPPGIPGWGFPRSEMNGLLYGRITDVGAPMTGIFPTKEMKEMDTKLDDGLPHKGKFRAVAGSGFCFGGSNPTWYYDTNFGNDLCAIEYHIEPYVAN